jgi:hypothetical protein
MAGVMTLINEDHQRLEGWFTKVESEPDRGWGFSERVAGLLIPRANADERVVYPAIRAAAPAGSDDVDGGLAEHRDVEGLLRELLAGDPEIGGVMV